MFTPLFTPRRCSLHFRKKSWDVIISPTLAAARPLYSNACTSSRYKKHTQLDWTDHTVRSAWLSQTDKHFHFKSRLARCVEVWESAGFELLHSYVCHFSCEKTSITPWEAFWKCAACDWSHSAPPYNAKLSSHFWVRPYWILDVAQTTFLISAIISNFSAKHSFERLSCNIHSCNKSLITPKLQEDAFFHLQHFLFYPVMQVGWVFVRMTFPTAAQNNGDEFNYSSVWSSTAAGLFGDNVSLYCEAAFNMKSVTHVLFKTN